MKKFKSTLAIICSFLLGTLLLVLGIQQFLSSKRLIDHGKVAMGKVLDFEQRRKRGGGRDFYLQVEYQTDGAATFTCKAQVKRALFDSVRVSGPIKVHYLPEAPSVCAVGETVSLQYMDILLGAVFLGTAIFLIFCRLNGT
jgi:hypothetical protein